MIVEGVNFNEAVCREMSEEEFVAQMMPVFFQDRNERQRERMLRDIYSRIASKA